MPMRCTRTSASPGAGWAASGTSMRRNCFGCSSWMAFILAAGARSEVGRKIHAPEFIALSVAVGNGRDLRFPIDPHGAEVLLFRVRSARLAATGARRPFQLRAEGVVESARRQAHGVQRAADKFPEAIELAELRLRGIVKQRGRVMNVGRQPKNVSNTMVFNEAEEFGDLQFAPQGRAVAVCGILIRVRAF